MTTLFANALTVRGFLGRDAEVHASEPITEDAYAVLTLCVESGVWWRPANEWISYTGWYSIVCHGPYFCGFTRGMKQGEYLEVEATLAIHRYAKADHRDPVYEIRATQLRRLEIPAVGVIEHYNG